MFNRLGQVFGSRTDAGKKGWQALSILLSKHISEGRGVVGKGAATTIENDVNLEHGVSIVADAKHGAG